MEKKRILLELDHLKREFRTEGPFYGVQVESAVHMTRGGVVANEKTEVLDVEGNVVPGIYAAGEVTNSSAAYSAAVICWTYCRRKCY